MSDEVTTPPAAPAAGATATTPPAAAPAPEPVKSGKGKVGKLLLRIAVPLVVVVAGIAWKFMSGDPTVASTGDCLIEAASADDMKTVACDDASAFWKVAGKVDDVKEAEFNATQEDTSCTAYPTAEASLWMGKKGGNGDVLCLEPLKK